MARVERVEEILHALASFAVVLGDDEVVDDGDGFDDHAVIAYTLTEPGATMNAYLFDVEGRLVRHLVRGALVGKEGGVVWNGLDQRGNRVPPGVYVLVTEVFDASGRVSRCHNAVAVAAP